MAWVRTPDDFWEREEVLGTGIEAAALHLAALGYSNRNLTDGRVPAAKALTLLAVDDVDALIASLVSAGWWMETDAGWQLVYLLELQPTAAAVLARREATARRVAEHRERASLPSSNGHRNGVTNAAGNAPSRNPDPDPGPGPVPVGDGDHPASEGLAGEVRTSAEVRQHGVRRNGGTPSAPRGKRSPTGTQTKLAEIIDAVKAEGIPIHVTPRDGSVLKSCAAPAGLIAEAYVAAARGLWDPGGDRFLPSNLSLHMVIDRLAGYQVEVEQQANWRYVGPAVSPLMRGAGHNVHGPDCDCAVLEPAF